MSTNASEIIFGTPLVLALISGWVWYEANINVLHSSQICIKNLTNKIPVTSNVENIVDPDQLASQKSAVQDLHCFQKRMYSLVQHGKV